MGRVKEVNPTEVRIFGKSKDNESPQQFLDRIQPQRSVLGADILEGTLEVETDVVMRLSGGVGVSGGEISLQEGSEIVVGSEPTS